MAPKARRVHRVTPARKVNKALPARKVLPARWDPPGHKVNRVSKVKWAQ